MTAMNLQTVSTIEAGRSDPGNIKAFRFNTAGAASFYAGRSMEDCKTQFLIDVGMNDQWFISDVAAYQLEDRHLDLLTVETRKTFREVIADLIRAGATFPARFASSEIEDDFSDEPKYQDEIGDLKKWFCQAMKRNYWTLGYFGGGAINLANATRIAREFQDENCVDFETITIDEIQRSRRIKHFKVLSSNQVDQTPHPDAELISNFWDYAHD